MIIYKHSNWPETITESKDTGLSRHEIFINDAATLEATVLKTVVVPEAEYQILPAVWPRGFITVKTAFPAERREADETNW